MRIAAEILRDLPEMIRRHVELPPGLMVTLTGTELSPDLSYCKIFFSVYGTEDPVKIDEVTRVLNGNKGHLRSLLAHILVMRQHPDLKFMHDETPARAARIEELLRQARESRDGGDVQ